MYKAKNLSTRPAKTMRIVRIVMVCFMIFFMAFGFMGINGFFKSRAQNIEPIVVRFDTQAQVDRLVTSSVTKSFVDESEFGGKKYLRMTGSGTQLEINNLADYTGQFSLDDYKYVKLAYRRTGITSADEYTQLFFYTDATAATANYDGYKWLKLYKPEPGQEKWVSSILSIDDSAQYASKVTDYDENGLFIDQNSARNNGSEWSGVVEKFRFIFSRWDSGNKERTTDIEYIAFFHTAKEAEAYPLTVEENAVVGALAKMKIDVNRSIAYYDGDTQTKAEEAVRAYVATYSTAKITLLDFAYIQPSKTAGSITCKVKLGEGEATETNSATLTWVIDEMPGPIVANFDTQAQVDKAVVYDGVKSFKDESAQGGKKYMSISGTAENIIFNNVQDFTGKFSLDFYSHIKISYRREGISTSQDGKEYTLLYFNNGMAQGYKKMKLNRQADGEDSCWETAVISIQEGTIKRYDENGVLISDGTFINGDTNPWTGTAELFRLDLSRYILGQRTIDLEYVGVFHTQEEAIAYPYTVEEYKIEGALNIMKAAGEVVMKYDDGITQEKAEQAVRNYVLQYTDAACTLLNVEYIAPTDTTDGNFSCTVKLGNGELSSDNSIALNWTIEKLPAPIVWAMDNEKFVSKLSAWNSTVTLEDGYARLKPSKSAQADGYCLEASYDIWGEVALGEYPIVKMRYQRKNAEDAVMQIYWWVDGKTGSDDYRYRTFSGGSLADDGDWMEVILDFRQVANGEIAVYLKNLTDNTSSTSVFTGGSGEFSGELTKFRFNFGRKENLERDTLIEYIGLFKTIEQAEQYVGAADDRLEETAEKIENSNIKLSYAQGAKQESAEQSVLTQITFLNGCGAKIVSVDYQESNYEYEGWLVLDLRLVSGGKYKDLHGVEFVIEKAFDEPILWTFNNQEFIDKLYIPTTTATKLELDNGVMKATNLTSEIGTGFEFYVEMPDAADNFVLQDYPYMKIKYKRFEPTYCNFYFYSNTVTGGSRQFGLGIEEDTWYTTVLNLSVNNKIQTALYHTNLETGVRTTMTYANSSTDSFDGTAYKLRFNLGALRFHERVMYIEYIAFFPTLEAANAYEGLADVAQSNANIALEQAGRAYEVDYYQANTESKAKEQARLLLQEILQDCESVSLMETGKDNGMLKVSVSTISYTAPTLNGVSGRYVCEVFLSNPEYNLSCSLGTFTLTVNGLDIQDKTVWNFNNTDFINELSLDDASASLTADNRLCLTGKQSTFGFSYSPWGSGVFSTEGCPYIRVILRAEKYIKQGKISFNANNVIWEVPEISAGNTVLALDLKNGKLYINGVLQTGEYPVMQDWLKSFELSVTTDGALYVTSIGFFHTETEAEEFSTQIVQISEDLQSVVAALNGQNFNIAYVDGQDEAAAMLRAEEILLNNLSKGVSLEDLEILGFGEATAQANGYAEIQATLGYGPLYSREYAIVTYCLNIAVKPNAPVVWTFEETFVQTLSGQGGATLTSENGVLRVDSKKGLEDSFGFNILSIEQLDSFYLQDYPFIKIKVKRYGYKDDSSTGMGTAQLYFWNDEASGTPSRQFRIGDASAEGEWTTIIIDMNTGGWFYNLEENTPATKMAFTSNSGHEFKGLLTSFRLTLGRHITVDRTAYIEYIAFCTSKEQALAYNGDGYVTSWEVQGKERAVTQKVLPRAKTIEAKIRLEMSQAGKTMTILSDKSAENDAYNGLYVNPTGELVYVYDGVNYTTSGVNLYRGKWTHVAVVHDGTQVRLYVDGVAKATKVASGTLEGNYLRAISIGCEYNGENQFRGNIREVCLWSVARSEAEISAHVLNACEEKAEGLLALWTLTKKSGGRFANSVDADNFAAYQDGLNRNYHEFTGEDHLVSQESLNGTPATIELWIKPKNETPSEDETLFASGNISLTRKKNGQLAFVYGGVALFTTQGLTIPAHEWTHLAITVDAETNQTCLYKNGVLFEMYFATVSETVSSGVCTIGAENEANYFVGGISCVNLWATVRTQNEIVEQMNFYPQGTEEGLLASWRLDMQDDLEFADSVQGNVMVLTSDGWYKKDFVVSEGAFTIAHIPDIQNLHVTNPEYIEGIFKWIAENTEELNMLLSINIGDATQNASRYEWAIVRAAYEYLDGVLPYWFALGNHDYPVYQDGRGADIRDAFAFREYFNIEERMSQADFGGTFEQDRLDNSYYFYTENGVNYMVLYLEYGPRDEVLVWADQVISAHPNHKVIIANHAYFKHYANGVEDGQAEYLPADAKAQYGSEVETTINDGLEIREKLVKKHSNIILVTSGHSQGSGIFYRADEGEQGNVIFEVIADSSAMINGFPSQYDLICLYIFEADGTIRTCYYSPEMDMYWDTDNEISVKVG